MSLFSEIPPTAGLPIPMRDIFSLFLRGKHPAPSLEEEMNDFLGKTNIRLAYSGTAAFYTILKAIRKISSRKSVIIPAFICPLIPLAIHRAGLKAVACDINKYDFNFDYLRLKELLRAESGGILAIVPAHIAGIPSDIGSLQEISKDKGIFIIEDCAQSLGAKYQGAQTGTIGDFSFYSLCRGKGLTIYEGGAIANKTEFNAAVDAAEKETSEDKFISEGIKLLELLGYAAFYRKRLFWLVYRLPQLFWERLGQPERAAIEYFTIDFPLHKVSRIRKRVGQAGFHRLRQAISGQRQKALRYIEAFKDAPGMKLISESPGDRSNYPYLTAVFNQPLKCRQVYESLKDSGLGISRIYLSAITDYSYLNGILPKTDTPNARWLAQSHLTLTTSQFLNNKEQETVIENIRKHLA